MSVRVKEHWMKTQLLMLKWNSVLHCCLVSGSCATVQVSLQLPWIKTSFCHLSCSCWTTSPVSVMVCRSGYVCCCCPLPLWASACVSGCTMDMCTFRLWAFSKRLLHIKHSNSRSASALCLVMWYFSDARWRHWKPQTSHLIGGKNKSIYNFSCLGFWLLNWETWVSFIPLALSKKWISVCPLISSLMEFLRAQFLCHYFSLFYFDFWKSRFKDLFPITEDDFGL